MKIRVHNWGNGLAVGIPSSYAAQLNLHQESEVDLVVEEQSLRLVPVEDGDALADLLGSVTHGNLHGESEPEVPTGREFI